MPKLETRKQDFYDVMDIFLKLITQFVNKVDKFQWTRERE